MRASTLGCRRSRACQGAALLLAALGCAASESRADGAWSGTVAATTDYIFRGVSQTYNGAALQAGLTYQSSSGWFVGTWGSNVDPYPFGATAVELNLYGGFGWTVKDDWTVRVLYTHYLYAWDSRPSKYDYDELAVTVGFRDLLAATISYEPDNKGFSALGYYAHNRSTAAFELSGRWPLPHGIALQAGAGYYALHQLYGVNYWSGSVGANYVHGRFELAVTRFFSGAVVARLFEDASADGRWVVTGIWRF